MSEHSKMYVTFCYFCVIVALAMLGGSLWFMPVNFATKGYLGMGILFLCGSLVTLIKTLRDIQESEKSLAKLEKAKNEQLLTEFGD